MFLNIDQQPQTKLAARDSQGSELTFGEIVKFSVDFSELVEARALIFILSENVVGSLCGYIGSIDNKIVPLLLGADLENRLLIQLYNTYLPNYAWIPANSEKFNSIVYEVVWEKYGYQLVRFDNPGHELYEDLSLLLSTSGSTGSPKLVRHNYTNISSNAKNIAKFFAITSNDKAMATLPLQYTMGLSVVTSYLFAGAAVLLTDLSLLDQKFWQFLKENEATSFSGVPFSYDILKKLRFFRMDLPHLELLNQGGGKLSHQLFEEVAAYANATNKRFIATYGQTEGTARMSYLPAENACDKIASIGIPIPEGEMFLIDAEGEVIEGFNEEGELVYKGPNVTLGYAEILEDLGKGDENFGILRTGDYAVRDQDGFYFILGRKKRFLKIMGNRISLDQIEMLIKNELGMDSMAGGDDKKLVISITDPEKTKEVLSLVTDRFNIFHRVVEVIVIEEIKRNKSGKIIA